MTTTKSPSAQRRILFLLSDTGGGHRAAARAIEGALEDRYPDHYDMHFVDVFRTCTPFPYNKMPEIYPVWVTYSSITWQMAYIMTDGRLRSRFFLDMAFLSWRKRFHRMLQSENADVIVSVHSLFNRGALHILDTMPDRPPFITVVTDLVSTPVSWYQKAADFITVPTEDAFQRGLDIGIDASQMQVTGLPVHPDFVNNLVDRAHAREQLGWDANQIAVLLVSGGDGMGPVFETVRAINEARLNIQLAIVAGRNEHLQHRLQNLHWNQPTKVYPFVDYMATLMAAADIIITKAGPATIAEAAVAGLPMILSGRVPGQEDGNVRLVVNNRAGVYAPAPHLVVRYLKKWSEADESVRLSFSEAAKSLARPQAAWTVAELIHAYANDHSARKTTVRHQPSWSRLLSGLRPLSDSPLNK